MPVQCRTLREKVVHNTRETVALQTHGQRKGRVGNWRIELGDKAHLDFGEVFVHRVRRENGL